MPGCPASGTGRLYLAVQLLPLSDTNAAVPRVLVGLVVVLALVLVLPLTVVRLLLPIVLFLFGAVTAATDRVFFAFPTAKVIFVVVNGNSYPFRTLVAPLVTR